MNHKKILLIGVLKVKWLSIDDGDKRRHGLATDVNQLKEHENLHSSHWTQMMQINECFA